MILKNKDIIRIDYSSEMSDNDVFYSVEKNSFETDNIKVTDLTDQATILRSYFVHKKDNIAPGVKFKKLDEEAYRGGRTRSKLIKDTDQHFIRSWIIKR